MRSRLHIIVTEETHIRTETGIGSKRSHSNYLFKGSVGYFGTGIGAIFEMLQDNVLVKN